MYKFELENVLDVRKHVEDSLKSELSSMEQLIRKEKIRMNDYLMKKAKLSQTIQKKLSSGATSNEYLLFCGFINKINQDIDVQTNKVIETEQKRDTKREELINAVKNRKALEILKEKRTTEYKVNQNRIELHNLDDFSSIQHTRRMEAN